MENKEIQKEDKCYMMKKERELYINKILRSPSTKKIVVGGPGTGKTFLFKEILKRKNKSLTLTFVNPLVDDLSLKLYGISSVKTLHSFAQKEFNRLRKNKIKIKIFPKLPEVIKEDAKILLKEDIEFKKLFNNEEDDSKYIDFYRRRKNYYKPYYGYSDVIYGIVKMYKKYKDKSPNTIPKYNQIIIDEFQDFNKLEVSLIDLLSEKSPILLTGDDDQALYEDFKDASPKYIRQRYYNRDFGYEPFTLPYCSRCTSVIVGAINDIIGSAVKRGFLKDRIKKTFVYFEDDDKNIICNQNPQIIHCQQFHNAIPSYIQNQIDNIAKEKQEKFSVLIISPFRSQAEMIDRKLKENGFNNIEFVKKENDEATILEGLKILMEDKVNNLGWRIVSRYILSDKEFNNLIKKSDGKNAKQIKDIANNSCKEEIKDLLVISKAVKNGKKVEQRDIEDIFKKIKRDKDLYNLVEDLLEDDIEYSKKNRADRSIRKIPINITTIHGSKGLSKDYVFITHFDDEYFIKDKCKNKIRDQEICNFIVSLARAKIKVFLISSKDKKPTFLKWIKEDRIEEN